MTCRNELVLYYISKGFIIFETEVGGFDNIPIIAKEKINATHLHQENSLLTRKADIPSISNTQNKIIFARDFYENDVSYY